MAIFIIMTEAQADTVRGPSVSNPSAALAPIERQGGIYIVGANVLLDPAHVAHHEYLAALPQMDSSDPGFPAEVE